MYLYREQQAYRDDKDQIYEIDTMKRSAPDGAKLVSIREEVGYWRKANQIHNWFVQNVQGGEDNCADYTVSYEQLEELLRTVKEVLAASTLVPGKVSMGQQLVDGEWQDILEDGKVIEDPTVAKKLLPTQEGLFFGGYDYDEWYLAQLHDTVAILEKVLERVDDHWFTYNSWW